MILFWFVRKLVEMLVGNGLGFFLGKEGAQPEMLTVYNFNSFLSYRILIPSDDCSALIADKGLGLLLSSANEVAVMRGACVHMCVVSPAVLLEMYMCVLRCLLDVAFLGSSTVCEKRGGSYFCGCSTRGYRWFQRVACSAYVAV